MSKKLAFIIVLAVVFVLLLAGSSFAATGWVHGNYGATTDACAGCHVAHAATLPKLLKSGETQAHFCFLCHGTGGTGAPYDAQFGQIMMGTPITSTAGGFEKTGGSDGDAITSRHKVWGYASNAAVLNVEDTASRTDIPGGTNTITTGLVCGSCHDPHAGGALTLAEADVITGYQAMTGGINPRLLRKSLFGTGGLDVLFTVNDLGNWQGDPTNDVMVVYEVKGYISGSNGWCGGCHDKFNKDEGSGSDKTGDTMYRHAMGVQANLTELAGREYTDLKVAGTPTEGTTPGDGTVACLTCHRAHATTVEAAGWASSWSTDGGTGLGSALLRMDNRGVCWSCHDAASANLPGWWN